MPITSTQGVMSTGRDCTVVLMGPFGRVDIPNVTGFDAKEVTATIRVDRMDGVQMEAELPKGWQGTIEAERANNALDVLLAAGEEAWISGGLYSNSTLYQFVSESDGSQTVFSYDNVSLKIDPGTWKPDAAVRQHISFMANRRRII